MQAIFRFNGSEEIVVSNQVSGVLIELLRGNARPGFSSPTGEALKENPEDRILLGLSKAHARSLAGAIMGAAAEL